MQFKPAYMTTPTSALTITKDGTATAQYLHDEKLIAIKDSIIIATKVTN